MTPAAREDLDWMDDVLNWDTEPCDDDPGIDDERVTFGRIAAMPGIAEDVMVTGGSVTEDAYATSSPDGPNATPGPPRAR